MGSTDGQPTLPGYRRVAEELRKAVHDGRWAPDEPLPTDTELEEEFGVGRQTVRRAYLDLVNEGLVYRVRGRGTFITPEKLRYGRAIETVDDLLALSTDTEMETVEPLGGAYDKVAARHLQLDGRLMYGMRWVRRHQGKIFCHTAAYFPPRAGRLIEGEAAFIEAGERSPKTVIGTLSALGVQIRGAEQSMTAKAADDLDVSQLGCGVGDPLLHVERLYLDATGTPVEWAVSDFLPEHYTHRLHLGRRSAPRDETDSSTPD